MAKIIKTAVINAPVERVFGYIRETTNLPEVWPNLLQVRDVQRLPNGGNRSLCVYRMIGMRFELISEDVEYIPNRRIVSKTGGGIQSVLTWQFEPEDGKTRLSLEAEYTMPTPLLGRLAEGIVARINEKDIGELVNILKIKFDQAPVSR